MPSNFNRNITNIEPPLEQSMESRKAITDFLFINDIHERVDFAFVLGSPSLISVEPAIELYQKGFTQQLIISGHGPQINTNPNIIPEAQLLKEYAIKRGIPADRILIETKATNTLENFRNSNLLIESQIGWSSISKVAICGKPFHMRRALMTARTQWPSHVQLLMTPSNHPDDPNAQTWWQSNAGKAHVFKELNAISIYAMKGDIGDF